MQDKTVEEMKRAAIEKIAELGDGQYMGPQYLGGSYEEYSPFTRRVTRFPTWNPKPSAYGAGFKFPHHWKGKLKALKGEELDSLTQRGFSPSRNQPSPRTYGDFRLYDGLNSRYFTTDILNEDIDDYEQKHQTYDQYPSFDRNSEGFYRYRPAGSKVHGFVTWGSGGSRSYYPKGFENFDSRRPVYVVDHNGRTLAVQPRKGPEMPIGYGPSHAQERALHFTSPEQKSEIEKVEDLYGEEGAIDKTEAVRRLKKIIQPSVDRARKERDDIVEGMLADGISVDFPAIPRDPQTGLTSYWSVPWQQRSYSPEHAPVQVVQDYDRLGNEVTSGRPITDENNPAGKYYGRGWLNNKFLGDRRRDYLNDIAEYVRTVLPDERINELYERYTRGNHGIKGKTDFVKDFKDRRNYYLDRLSDKDPDPDVIGHAASRLSNLLPYDGLTQNLDLSTLPRNIRSIAPSAFKPYVSHKYPKNVNDIDAENIGHADFMRKGLSRWDDVKEENYPQEWLDNYYWEVPDDAFAGAPTLDYDAGRELPLPYTEYDKSIAEGRNPLVRTSDERRRAETAAEDRNLESFVSEFIRPRKDPGSAADLLPIEIPEGARSGSSNDTGPFSLSATYDRNGNPGTNLYWKYYGDKAPDVVERILRARGYSGSLDGATPDAVQIQTPEGHPFSYHAGTHRGIMGGIPATGTIQAVPNEGRAYAKGEYLSLPALAAIDPMADVSKHETAHPGNTVAHNSAWYGSGGVPYSWVNDTVTHAKRLGPGVFSQPPAAYDTWNPYADWTQQPYRPNANDRFNAFNYHWDMPDEFAAAYSNLLRNEALRGIIRAPDDFDGFLRENYGDIYTSNPKIALPGLRSKKDQMEQLPNTASDKQRDVWRKIHEKQIREAESSYQEVDPSRLSRQIDMISSKLGLPSDTASLVKSYLMLRELDPEGAVKYMREQGEKAIEKGMITPRQLEDAIKAFGTPEERYRTYDRLRKTLDPRFLRQLGSARRSDSDSMRLA